MTIYFLSFSLLILFKKGFFYRPFSPVVGMSQTPLVKGSTLKYVDAAVTSEACHFSFSHLPTYLLLTKMAKKSHDLCAFLPWCARSICQHSLKRPNFLKMHLCMVQPRGKWHQHSFIISAFAAEHALRPRVTL